MSGDLSTLEKSVEEILINLMDEKFMSIGIQASSMGGFQASPSTGRRSSQIATEKRSKHRSDLANAKKIPSVLPNYISPLVGVVSHDRVPCDFEYMLITAYLPKGIHTVGLQLGLIPALKINDFNLVDRKNYAMLAPHRYLKKMIGKKPKIIPQPWIKEIMQSMILNVMTIPHFGRHQEVNACVKLLL
jgi:hypothetical protein